MQNVLTDLKAWLAPLEPEQWHNGKLCKVRRCGSAQHSGGACLGEQRGCPCGTAAWCAAATAAHTRAATFPSIPSPQVHAGFLHAWRHDGFRDKVLARLRELDMGPHPLRFWVCGWAPAGRGGRLGGWGGWGRLWHLVAITLSELAAQVHAGARRRCASAQHPAPCSPRPLLARHSLGGALAALAALEIRSQHPKSPLSLYTYGCPRVRRCCSCWAGGSLRRPGCSTPAAH